MVCSSANLTTSLPWKGQEEGSSFYFVLPAYNEAANIAETIRVWYGVVERINREGVCRAVLAVADDGSRDDTYRIMSEFRMEHFVPLTKPNGGHGPTVLYLYRYALEHGADYVFQTDSDGQTSPDEFWQMYDGRADYDFQIGHRRHRQDGWQRVFVTRMLGLLVWLVFGVRVTDANAPFRLMRASALREVLRFVPDNFFLSNVAISAIAVKRNYRVCFLPITFRPRQGGENSINMRRIIRIGWKAIGDLWRINARLRNN